MLIDFKKTFDSITPQIPLGSNDNTKNTLTMGIKPIYTGV